MNWTSGTSAVRWRCRPGLRRRRRGFLLGLASSNPWILGVVGWIDLHRQANLDTRLQARASSAVLQGIPPPGAGRAVSFGVSGRWAVQPWRGNAPAGGQGLRGPDPRERSAPPPLPSAGGTIWGRSCWITSASRTSGIESAAEWARRIAPLAAQEHCELQAVRADHRSPLARLGRAGFAPIPRRGSGMFRALPAAVRFGLARLPVVRNVRSGVRAGREGHGVPLRGGTGCRMGAATPAACTASAISKRRRHVIDLRIKDKVYLVTGGGCAGIGGGISVALAREGANPVILGRSPLQKGFPGRSAGASSRSWHFSRKSNGPMSKPARTPFRKPCPCTGASTA